MEAKELTLDTQKQLNDFIGFDTDSTFKYVPKVFKENLPKEQWPVFTLKSKNGLEIASIEDNAGYIEYGKGKDDNVRYCSQSGKVRIETLRKGLKGVKNFQIGKSKFIKEWIEATGKLITLENGEEKSTSAVQVDSIIKHFKPALQIDLQNAINERSELTEDELQGLE